MVFCIIPLDILTLHSKIMNLRNAAPLSFDAVDITDKIIHGLRSVFPSWSSFQNGIYSMIVLALLVLDTFIPGHCDKTCLVQHQIFDGQNIWLENKNGFHTELLIEQANSQRQLRFCTGSYQPKTVMHCF